MSAAAAAGLAAESTALRRAAEVDRRAAEAAAAREGDTAAALVAAEARAAVLAPGGGGVLESPLGWREFDSLEGAAAAAAITEGEVDPALAVFLSDSGDGDLGGHGGRGGGDALPPTKGCAVMLLTGGDTMTALVLEVHLETEVAVAASTHTTATGSAWDFEPAMRWVQVEVRGPAPRPRQNPAVCAVPAATAAAAAAAGGADPAGVVGGVFVYGGFDGTRELSDAAILIRRRRGSTFSRRGRGDEDIKGQGGGFQEEREWEWEWQWVELPAAAHSPAPPLRSHALAFATPMLSMESAVRALRAPATRGEEEDRACACTDIYVMGGYRSGSGAASSAGGLRNDLWRLDAATLCWSSPEMFGDVPPPRRDAAAAVAAPIFTDGAAGGSIGSSGRSGGGGEGQGHVLVHGGCASDGEPLSDVYSLDLASLSWTRLPPDSSALRDSPSTSSSSAGLDDNGYGVTAKIVTTHEASGRPVACFPRARSRHAATVVGGVLLIHGGRSGVDGRAPDHMVYALDLETLTWRCLRTGAGASPPPASRCAGHAMFAHRAGVLLVGAGVSDPSRRGRNDLTAPTPPPVYLLEMPAAREGRRLRAAVAGAVEARGAAEDRAVRAIAAAAAAADEVRLVRAAAAAVKEEADNIAAAEANGRDAQRVLRAKLTATRGKLADAEAAAVSVQENCIPPFLSGWLVLPCHCLFLSLTL